MGSLKVGSHCLDIAAVETLGQLLGDRLGLALAEVSQGRVMPATNDPLDVVRGLRVCDDVDVPHDQTVPHGNG